MVAFAVVWGFRAREVNVGGPPRRVRRRRRQPQEAVSPPAGARRAARWQVLSGVCQRGAPRGAHDYDRAWRSVGGSRARLVPSPHACTLVSGPAARGRSSRMCRSLAPRRRVPQGAARRRPATGRTAAAPRGIGSGSRRPGRSPRRRRWRASTSNPRRCTSACRRTSPTTSGRTTTPWSRLTQAQPRQHLAIVAFPRITPLLLSSGSLVRHSSYLVSSVSPKRAALAFDARPLLSSSRPPGGT